MVKLRAYLFCVVIFVMLSAACAPQSIPVTGGSPQPVDTLVPTPDSPNSIAALQTVPLGPPVMQVGSAYRYFDGSLLDAVPNDGAFPMGTASNGSPNQITLSDFWIYSTEVSNQMYAWCVSLGQCTPPDKKDNPHFREPGFPNYPVVGVTWQQAADYCSFAHGHLPTEAEWEKAASWDAEAKVLRPYPWGADDPSCSLLNFMHCFGRADSVLQFGQGRSFYGVYNMEGNVSEWVADWYRQPYTGSGQDPTGPDSGTERSIRGSSYDSDAGLSSPSLRFFAKPAAHRANLGFRCVVREPAHFAPYCQMPVFYGIDPSGANANNPCPDPSIEHVQVCAQNSVRLHNITVKANGATLVQVSGLEACQPANNDLGVQHQCGANVTVKVNAFCNAVPAGVVTCPPNYQQDPANPKMCTSPGGPGACPAGFQYDTSTKCCSAASDTSASVPLCSVGQHFYNAACVDDGSGLQQPNSIIFSTGADLSCVPGTPLPNTGGATATLASTKTPIPSNTPAASATPQPTNSPEASSTPAPSSTPAATNTSAPEPTNTSAPEPSSTSAPAPTATDQPAPTGTP